MPENDDVVPMVMCPQCEHLVPETNLSLHEARCQGRKRPARDTETTESDNSDDQEESGDERGRHNNHRNTRQHRSNSEQGPFLPRASWEARPASQQQHNEPSASSGDEGGDIYYDDESSDNDDIVSPPVAAVDPAAAAARPQREVIDLIEDEEGQERWNCPRCTLENVVSSTQCDACSYRIPGSERPPDPVRRERLVGGPQPMNVGGTGGMISHTAILGSLLGGAAYSRGQSMPQGILNGGLSSALGGVLLDQLAQQSGQAGTRMQQQQTTMTTSSGETSRSISFVRTPDGRAYMTQGASPAPGVGPNRGNGQNEIHQLLAGLLAQQVLNRGGARVAQANPDHMSYEQLLQAFGTGGENLGADEGQIRSLPSATIEDVDRLPVDSRQCSICLEDFKNRDKRKILPCLHGFHADCVDKWLRTNGSCPICKHRLDR